MGGLAKGLRIIESFGPDHPQHSITSAAQASAVTPAAARRCLLTLESLGYVSYDGKYFRPTPRMARLGASYGQISPLPALAEPILAMVRDEIGESSSLAVLDGHSAAFVARVDCERPVTASVRLGARLPSHNSATGRVLLADLDDTDLDEHLRGSVFEASTPNTLTSIEQVRARILDVRARGFAITNEELELGVRTMAVPVRDTDERTRAAMSVAVLASRATVAEMEQNFLPVLQRAADRLGGML
jgi:IclR family pca regulon transcriptional regulator